MDIDRLNYIIAIAKSGSVSKAAEELGITQPALSRYLKKTEKEIGTPLFYYEGRRMHITQAGEIYIAGARRIKNLEIQMVRSFEQQKEHKHVSISIGMSPFRGGVETAFLYPKLLSAYPNIEVRIREGNYQQIMQLLRDNEIDCSLNLYDEELVSGFKAATLTCQEIVLAVPKDCVLSDKGGTLDNPGTLLPDDFALLDNVPFVLLSEETLLGKKIRRELAHYLFEPDVILETSNVIAVSRLLDSGSYAGFALKNGTEGSDRLAYFSLPDKEQIFSALIFRDDYTPDSVEVYLYSLECNKAREESPEFLHINHYGEDLLRRYHA